MILFVCTGNICRSPMAAGILRQRLVADGLAQTYEVVSAGTWAMPAQPASAYARKVMAGRGIDIRDHRTRRVTADMLAQADLVLVMTEGHREALLAEFPGVQKKTYLMSEMAGKSYEIADPYGSSLAHYEYCAEDLATIIDAGYERILRLAGGNSQAEGRLRSDGES